MLRHLGYSADAYWSGDLSDPWIRLKPEARPDQIRDTIRQNLGELARVLRSNAERGIFFYRASSHIIPYASHPEKTIAWWDEFAGDLARIGHFVRKNGLRIEMNPGRHSLLNSPSPETMALSILELGWHVRFLDALQVDASHKLVLRVGVTFGDRAGSINRFISVVNGLPAEWKTRFVVENDASQYGLKEVLEVASKIGVPVVVACHGQWAGGCEQRQEIQQKIARSFATWSSKDGVPIVHLGPSTQSRGFSGPSGAGFCGGDVETILGLTPRETPYDCLVETAQADQGFFALVDRMTTRETLLVADRFNQTIPTIS